MPNAMSTKTTNKNKTKATSTKVETAAKPKNETAAQTAMEPKAAKTKELSEINKATAAAKIDTKAEPATTEREVKYAYPSDCTSKADRKDFRRKARQQDTSFQKTLAKLKASNDKKDAELLKETEAKYLDFSKDTYTHPEKN